MKEFDLFGYQVEIDEEVTREWYDKADEWGCECEDCKYFISLSKKRELPSVILDTLSQFEIAPEKATYVCEIITEDGMSLYQFSYRIAGNILNEIKKETNVLSFGDVSCCHEPYPYGAPGFPEPHFDLEFWVRLQR